MVQIQFQLAILLKALFTKIFHVKIRLVKNLPYVTPYVTHGLAFQDTLKYSMLLLSLFSIGPVLCHVTFFFREKNVIQHFFIDLPLELEMVNLLPYETLNILTD